MPHHPALPLAALFLLTGCADLLAAPVKSAPKPGGVFVLDDCDPVYQGKAAYGDNLSYIDGAGKLVFRVTGLNTCQMIGSNRQIAYDGRRGHVWVAECVAAQIRKFDLEGEELLVRKDIKPSAIAVDPETGNLWVVRSNGRIDGGDVAVLDPRGKEVAAHDAGGFDIAYDGKGKAFWVAGKDLTK